MAADRDQGQVLGQQAGAPGYIFSLGAVLAFAAGGHGPFGSGSAAALMYRLVNSPAQLDELDPDVRAVAVASYVALGDAPVGRKCAQLRPGKPDHQQHEAG